MGKVTLTRRKAAGRRALDAAEVDAVDAWLAAGNSPCRTCPGLRERVEPVEVPGDGAPVEVPASSKKAPRRRYTPVDRGLDTSGTAQVSDGGWMGRAAAGPAGIL